MKPERNRGREREWGERLVLWIVVGGIVATLVLAFLFQLLT